MKNTNKLYNLINKNIIENFVKNKSYLIYTFKTSKDEIIFIIAKNLLFIITLIMFNCVFNNYYTQYILKFFVWTFPQKNNKKRIKIANSILKFLKYIPHDFKHIRPPINTKYQPFNTLIC